MMRGPTRDHDEIRKWAKSCHAIPAEVIPYKFDGEPAELRFLFNAAPKDQTELREISWESFFAVFDLLGLALVHDGKSQYELVMIAEKPKRRFEGKVVS